VSTKFLRDLVIAPFHRGMNVRCIGTDGFYIALLARR
jgi:hypothetical protein